MLYVDGDATEGRTAEYWVQSITGSHTSFSGNTDITAHIFNSDTANFTGIWDQVSNTSTAGIGADSGNYIVFDGLTADTFLVRAEEFSSPSALRANISAVQLIATVVPEPSTFGLANSTLKCNT